MKCSEGALVESFKLFLIERNLIDQTNSSFDDMGDTKADVELKLMGELWVGVEEDYLIIEAKSHHSKDSANSINKMFGQLLKETGKKSWGNSSSCLAILILSDKGAWRDTKGKNVNRSDGEEYYRTGFSRIDKNIYREFGSLVRAKYVLSYSVVKNELKIYKWDEFYSNGFFVHIV